MNCWLGQIGVGESQGADGTTRVHGHRRGGGTLSIIPTTTTSTTTSAEIKDRKKGNPAVTTPISSYK